MGTAINTDGQICDGTTITAIAALPTGIATDSTTIETIVTSAIANGQEGIDTSRTTGMIATTGTTVARTDVGKTPIRFGGAK
jgi:hypothetical protein